MICPLPLIHHLQASLLPASPDGEYFQLCGHTVWHKYSTLPLSVKAAPDYTTVNEWAPGHISIKFYLQKRAGNRQDLAD